MPEFERSDIENEYDDDQYAAEEAVEDPAESPEPGSEDFEGWFNRGLNFARLGFPDRAAEAFEQAAFIRPDDAGTQFNLGTAYLSMGMFLQAIVNLDRAIALNPRNADAYGNRAVAHTAIGEDDRAGEDVRRAIELGAPPDGLDAVLHYVRERRGPTTEV